ncbi:uncharacterized protein JCM6883_005216 [Sporobolomyces salmoneus]|uniref:uncharacterized protein n=1 Tax=Sporobolomyces salmoneus TaxID=183962 RepID=UPI00317A8A8B
MSVTFLMIPILTLTPPTPLPSSSPLSFSFTASFPRINSSGVTDETNDPSPREDRARSDVKEIVRSYLQGGGGGGDPCPSLPFTNLEVIRSPVQVFVDEREVSVKVSTEKVKKPGRAGWVTRKRARKAERLVKVDQKLDCALSQLGW